MITQEQFEDYEGVRESGVTNMFDIRRVSDLSGLTREQIREIFKTYKELIAKYPGVRRGT